MFSPEVAERIGWYVYALRDPRDGRVFYIGKGKESRVFHHALAAAAAADGGMSPKLELIREIHGAGHEVDAYILRHGISTERAAYDVEATLIDLLALLDPAVDNDRFQLTNLVRGQRHALFGLVHVDVAATLYEAPRAPEIEKPTLLLRIPKLWTPQMPARELYDATRGWWRLGSRRDGVRYVFAVSKGVVRGAYRVESWRQRVQGDRDWQDDIGRLPRWGFEGQRASEMEQFLNTSVAHLYKRGEQAPKYVNC